MKPDLQSLTARIERRLGKLLGSRDYVPFIVLSRSRTGSYLLLSYLNNHPNILAGDEIFRHLDGRDYRKVLAHAFGRQPRHIKAAGFKIFYYHPLDLACPELWQTLVGNTNVRVIHLMRRDLTATLISRHIAGLTDEWVRTTKSASKQEQRSLSSVTVDPVWFREQLLKTVAWQQHGRTQFSDHPYIEVFYEDLVKNTNTTFGALTSFLSVSPMTPSTNHLKQGGMEPRQLITNYQELLEMADELQRR